VGGISKRKLFQEGVEIPYPVFAGFSVDNQGKGIEGYLDGIKAILLKGR